VSALYALTTLQILFGLCLAAFCVYTGIAVWAAHRWYQGRRPPNPEWTPAVTILKPVRGVDAEAYENFASFCRLDYPDDRIQLLFGALDPADPALELARQLQSEFPHIDIGTIPCGPESVRGPNLKVCNLAAMLPSAKHDLLLLCDSDMRVLPDYLRRVVAPFEPKQANVEDSKNPEAAQNTGRQVPKRRSPVGLVTCPYRGHRVQSFAAALEALGIGADFIPSTLVSRALEGVSFALGSTIALPRSVLSELGGFESLFEELADDFRLGHGARRAGYEVVLSDYVVDDVLGRERFQTMWARRLRWARTVRACRPAGYAGAFITHGTAFALLFLASTAFAPSGWAVAATMVALRLATALLIAERYTRDPNILRYLPLLPAGDLLSFALYITSYCGNRISWRGERFRLLRGGKLEKISRG
jgi:ceramide glucosyltransferase